MRSSRIVSFSICDSFSFYALFYLFSIPRWCSFSLALSHHFDWVRYIRAIFPPEKRMHVSVCKIKHFTLFLSTVYYSHHKQQSKRRKSFLRNNNLMCFFSCDLSFIVVGLVLPCFAITLVGCVLLNEHKHLRKSIQQNVGSILLSFRCLDTSFSSLLPESPRCRSYICIFCSMKLLRSV